MLLSIRPKHTHKKLKPLCKSNIMILTRTKWFVVRPPVALGVSSSFRAASVLNCLPSQFRVLIFLTWMFPMSSPLLSYVPIIHILTCCKWLLAGKENDSSVSEGLKCGDANERLLMLISKLLLLSSSSRLSSLFSLGVLVFQSRVPPLSSDLSCGELCKHTFRFCCFTNPDGSPEAMLRSLSLALLLLTPIVDAASCLTTAFSTPVGNAVPRSSSPDTDSPL